MNENTARGIISDATREISSAYKSNPVMTGLLVLLIGLTIGFGWYQIYKDGKTAAFIMGKEARIEQLQDKLLETVKGCKS